MSWKRLYAEDVAAAEGFEWDVGNAEDHDLYEAIEAMGYVWDERRTMWFGPESEVVLRQSRTNVQRARAAEAGGVERLGAWRIRWAVAPWR